MLRLTREVRLWIEPPGAAPTEPQPVNGHGGWPPPSGMGQFLVLRLTLSGELDASSNYLLNIKVVDERVRNEALPMLRRFVADERPQGPARLASELFHYLRDGWGGPVLRRLAILPSPFLSFEVRDRELPMVRLSQKFEFPAAHRLHNPALSDEENRRTFGKCNNPFGHGHNYQLQVTIAAEPDGRGTVLGVPELERIVQAAVIDRLDHRNLNVEVEEFRTLIPSVENIARVVYGLLKGPIQQCGVKLAAVTVWETEKTWCEVEGDDL